MITISIPYLFIIGIVLIPFFNHFYKKNFELFLIILIMFGFNIMHLIKPLNYYTKGMIIPIPFLIYIFLKEAKQKRIKLDSIGMWMLLYIFILVLGVIVAFVRGQGLKIGIIGAVFYGILLAYFIIASRDTIDLEKFFQYLIKLGMFASLILIIQYLVFTKFIFMSLPIEKANLIGGRGLRFVAFQPLISLTAIIAFAKFLRLKEKKYIYLTIWMLLHILFITKTRIVIGGLFMVFLVMYLQQRGLNKQTIKVTITALMMVLAVSLILFLTGSGYFMGSLQSDLFNERGGSIEIRKDTYSLYFQRFKENPLVGEGLVHASSEISDKAELQNFGNYISDVGVLHILIESGIIGLIWFLFGLKLIYVPIFKKQVNFTIGGYFLLALFTMITLDYFFYTTTITMFAVMIGLFSLTLTQRNIQSIL